MRSGAYEVTHSTPFAHRDRPPRLRRCGGRACCAQGRGAAASPRFEAGAADGAALDHEKIRTREAIENNWVRTLTGAADGAAGRRRVPRAGLGRRVGAHVLGRGAAA